MSDGEEERSRAGDPVYRYTQAPPSSALTDGRAERAESIVEHVETHIGDVADVYGELVPDTLPIDVLIVRPTEQRPYSTLVTAGMSGLPMSPPPEVSDERLAELVIALPPDWPLSEAAFTDEALYWPIRLLKTLARLPHLYDSWLWTGHTVPNGDPPLPYAPDTELCGAILFAPITAPESFARLEASDGAIQFLSVIPVYAAELRLKLEEGAGSLGARLDALGVTELLDPRRASVA